MVLVRPFSMALCWLHEYGLLLKSKKDIIF